MMFNVKFAALFLCLAASAIMAAEESPKTDKIKKPLPTDFPALGGEPAMPPNSPLSGVSDFKGIWYANHELLNKLAAYTPESISAEFGRRMIAEKNIHLKLVMAVVAAENGNGKSREIMQDIARNVNKAVTWSRMDALDYLVCSDHPPEWVFDEIYKALNDSRKVTGYQRERDFFGKESEPQVVSSLTDLLGLRLGQIKNPRSVSVLMKLAGQNHWAIESLGMLGDPVAIPLCLKLLRESDASIKKHKSDKDYPPDDLVGALGALKAKEAVPILLEYLNSEAAIKALGQIGDERAIESLKKIESSGDKYHAVAARLALIKIEKDDPYPKWFAILDDNSPDSPQREALWELGYHPDPRAIPYIVVLIKTDKEGILADDAIKILAEYKFRAAVDGLIECFDFDFKGKAHWKYAYTPEMYAENIGGSLKKLTGQDFGSDKTQWIKWWKANSSSVADLK